MSASFWFCMLFFFMKGAFWAVPILWKQDHPGDRFAAIYITITILFVGYQSWS